MCFTHNDKSMQSKKKKNYIKHFVKLLTMRLVEYNKPDDISKILNYTSDSATVY